MDGAGDRVEVSSWSPLLLGGVVTTTSSAEGTCATSLGVGFAGFSLGFGDQGVGFRTCGVGYSRSQEDWC